VRLLVGAGLLVTVSLAGVFVAAAGTGEHTVEVRINHSRFAPESFEFEAGETVTFVIHNSDPIDHEFILGDDSVQRRHEEGSEKEHGAIPGEVSVPAGETRTTTYTFTEPGKLIIGCHLPGHYAYGMRAEVRAI